MDGFLRSGDNDAFSIGYYAQDDLPFIPAAAQAFTAYDRFFCSLLASTYPNREYMHAAQSYGKKDNTLPSARPGSRTRRSSPRWRPRASTHATSTPTCPVSALWGAPGLARSGRVQEYYERCAAGTLPALSFVDPSFAERGRRHVRATSTRTATCASARRSWPTSCTRSWSRRSGSAARCSSSTTSGAGSSTTWRRRACRTSARPTTRLEDFGQMGIRIPAVAVSPYARRRVRRPRRVRLRVDPEDDRVPLRAVAADPARRLRAQHRALVRLGVQAAARPPGPARPAATCSPPSARTARRRRSTAARRSGPGRTT